MAAETDNQPKPEPMTVAAPPASPLPGPVEPPAPAAAQPPVTTQVESHSASGGRKTFFAFAILLLLPFFASLPAMLYQRLAAGLWFDTVSLAVLAAAFTALMLLLLFELIYAVRARIDVGETGVRLTLPTRGGSMPKLAYRTDEIAYSDIAAVETRCEIYGGALAPVLMRGARIIRKDGPPVSLGYVNEANVDPTFPIPELAETIASRAGLRVTNRGNVRRQVRKKMLGLTSSADENVPFTDAEIAIVNKKHDRMMHALVAVIVLLLAGGIIRDVFEGNRDRGERASNASLADDLGSRKTAPAKR